MERRQLDRADLSGETIVRFFRRWWRSLVLLFGSSLLVTIGAAYLLPPEYETSARVLVKIGPESSAATVTLIPDRTVVSMELRDYINSRAEIFRSDLLLRRVVDELGVGRFLHTTGPAQTNLMDAAISRRMGDAARDLLDRAGLLRRLSPTESVISAVKKRLAVTTIPESSVIRLSFRWSDPVLAADFVNHLIELDKRHSVEIQRSSGLFDLVKEEVAQRRRAMAEVGEQLATAKLDSQVAEAEASIRALDRQLASLAAVERVSRVEARNPVYDALRLRESELEMELKKTRTRFDVDNPMVTSLTQQLAGVRDRLAKEPPTSTGDVTFSQNSARKTVEAERLNKEALLRGLLEKRAAFLTAAGSLPIRTTSGAIRESHVTQLEAERRIATRAYELAAQKLEDIRTSEMLDAWKIGSVYPIERAPVPARPFRSRLFILILGTIGSLSLAGILALVYEHFDRSLKSPTDIQRYLDLPTLSVIPLVKRASRVPLQAGALKEGYQHVRSHLVPLSRGIGRTVMIAASIEGEGVTTAATHLASVLASRRNRRCLLVDANLRTPAQHRLFKVPQTQGLSDLVYESLDPMSLVQETSIPGLAVVAAGLPCSDPLELFLSSQWEAALSTWRAHFDFIVIDTAPTQSYAEALLIASQVDGVILVVRAGGPSWEVVAETKRQLEQFGGKLLGTVLNRGV